jgi:hypothetical protein
METQAEGPPAPFVVGASRSGTTLLRVMLDSHPQLAIPAETHFLNRIVRAREPVTIDAFADLCVTTASWPNLGISRGALEAELSELPTFTVPDAVRQIYFSLARRSGKRRWGDKTPSYLAIMEQIQELLPEAAFIHVIRDGRDVSLSQRHLWWGPGEDIVAAATFWVDEITRARASAAKLHSYLEVRYEDLVLKPESVLARICQRIDLPFDPAMLDFTPTAVRGLQEVIQPFGPNGAGQMRLESFRSIYANTTQPLDPGKAGRWRSEMPADERRRFEEVAGPLLASLGYEIH